MWRASLIDYLKDRGFVSGDILEIGTFLGELTKTLATMGKLDHRHVVTVDICDFDTDQTVNARGVRMNEYYKRICSGDQFEIIQKKLNDLRNVIFIKLSSPRVTDKKLKLGKGKKFALIVLDGSKNNSIVRSDMKWSWGKLKKGGILAVHDYQGDIPDLTKTIDETVQQLRIKDAQRSVLSGWWLLLEKR